MLKLISNGVPDVLRCSVTMTLSGRKRAEECIGWDSVAFVVAIVQVIAPQLFRDNSYCDAAVRRTSFSKNLPFTVVAVAIIALVATLAGTDMATLQFRHR